MIQMRGASPVSVAHSEIHLHLRRYETISDLMNLQDQIESFQKLIFAHFRHSVNNECRISALVPLVKESYNIYRFITSMLRAMHRRTGDVDALEPLRTRYNSQHHNLRKFYFECSNLKYLTGLINVPKLGADPPNLLDNSQTPELPKRPTTVKVPTPPPAAPSPDAAMLREQAAMLKEYEEKQHALEAQKKAEEERRRQQELQQLAEMEEKQRQQAERERLAQEQLRLQQVQQFNDQNAQVVNQLQMEMLAMRGQFERDQIMLEQYDRVRPCACACLRVGGAGTDRP
jgi:signal transduction histidine kinase